MKWQYLILIANSFWSWGTLNGKWKKSIIGITEDIDSLHYPIIYVTYY